MNAERMRRGNLLPLHRGINFSSMEVEGNLGGAIFAAGSVICLAIGLPEARGLLAGSLVGGVGVAVLLAWWRR